MAMKTKLVTLGSRLKYHRKKNQLTQKVVAELIGVSSSAISQYEKGSIEPDLAILRKLATIYKVSADTLLDIDLPDAPLNRNDVKKELAVAASALRKATVALENLESNCKPRGRMHRRRGFVVYLSSFLRQTAPKFHLIFPRGVCYN